jgi:hypothetical protein
MTPVLLAGACWIPRVVMVLVVVVLVVGVVVELKIRVSVGHDKWVVRARTWTRVSLW